MKPWLRDDTKDWIHHVESRIQDIDYYIKETILWCEQNEVYSDKHVLIYMMMTCIWVCSMRQELISYNEITEILGVNEEVSLPTDELYDLGPLISGMDHIEMLEFLQNTLEE